MAGTTQRASTVALWADLWREVTELRDENAALRRRLRLPAVEYSLVEPDLEPPPSLHNCCLNCGDPLGVSPRERPIYCSNACRVAHRSPT